MVAVHIVLFLNHELLLWAGVLMALDMKVLECDAHTLSSCNHDFQEEIAIVSSSVIGAFNRSFLHQIECYDEPNIVTKALESSQWNHLVKA